MEIADEEIDGMAVQKPRLIFYIVVGREVVGGCCCVDLDHLLSLFCGSGGVTYIMKCLF